MGAGWNQQTVVLDNLATRLKLFREAKGLTKYRLDKLSGVSQTYIYRIEKGEIKNPRRDTLQSLAKGLDVTLARLIGETSPSDSWELVEISLKAYIPVYANVGEEMSPIDYVVCTRTQVPSETLRAYRSSSLYLEPEIRPNDTIIVDTALVPADGDLVVAFLEGQPAVKRYKEGRFGKSWLEDNDGHHEIKGVSIHGVVTEYVRKLR